MKKKFLGLCIFAIMISCEFQQAGNDPSSGDGGLGRTDFIPLERPDALETFILPVQGQSSIYEGDLQADYPDVDWETLDRLYIPAGEYRFMALRNLPDRDAERPLIITNYGGQVRFTGDHYYCVSLQGGSGWIFSGKFDSDLDLGDAAFPGHKNGYPGSSGTYGFEINGVDSSGIAVGGGASLFELEYVEIANVGFAGLSIKTDNTPDAVMDSVSIHDLYIHDTESEGVYIGNTSKNADEQHGFTNLKFYNNRVIRSGTEGAQFSHMGHGVEIHHNVFLMNAVLWKDPFMIYQSGCLQYMTRSGRSTIHHNLFIGGASALMSLRFLAAGNEELQSGDGVEIHNNYFSHGRNWFSYIHTDESNTVSELNFHNNVIREINYHLNELPENSSDTDPGILIRNPNNRFNPLRFRNNRWNGGEVFLQWIDETVSGIDISEENTVFENNLPGIVEPYPFLNPVLPGGEQDFSRVEVWVSYSNLYDFYVGYQNGDLAIYNGRYYLCTSDYITSGSSPDPASDPVHWSDLGAVTQYDDVRISSGSVYEDIGLYD